VPSWICVKWTFSADETERGQPEKDDIEQKLLAVLLQACQ